MNCFRHISGQRELVAHWYNRDVTNIFIIQFIGVIMIVAGMVALTASAHAFGTPLSPAEMRRASDEWNRKRNVYRLPISPETIVSLLIFLGGLGILAWSKFELCAFLGYWLPSLPREIKLLLSCR